MDGFGGYQTLLTCDKPVLAGIQQCCQHVSRRGKQVGKLGPGSLQASNQLASHVRLETQPVHAGIELQPDGRAAAAAGLEQFDLFDTVHHDLETALHHGIQLGFCQRSGQ